MMLQKSTLKIGILILACTLLLGIILMAVGVYYQGSLFISTGVGITIITALMITVLNLLNNKS